MLNTLILFSVILLVAGTLIGLSIRDHGRLVDVLRRSLTVENDDLKDRR